MTMPTVLTTIAGDMVGDDDTIIDVKPDDSLSYPHDLPSDLMPQHRGSWKCLVEHLGQI